MSSTELGSIWAIRAGSELQSVSGARNCWRETRTPTGRGEAADVIGVGEARQIRAEEPDRRASALVLGLGF